MALTLGSEFALFMHTDVRLTYTQIEAALADAGLDNNVIINRNPSGDGYDVHLIVRNQQPDVPLAAAETVRAFADAVETLDQEAEPEPPAE